MTREWAFFAAFTLAIFAASPSVRAQPHTPGRHKTALARKAPPKAKREEESRVREVLGKVHEKVRFEGFGSWGFSKPSVSLTQAGPTLMQWGLGIRVQYRVPDFAHFGSDFQFLAGIESDYRFIGQYSAINDLLGSYRGTRFNLISPSIGAVLFKDVVVEAELEFLGTYNLSNKSVEGADVSYQGPFGGRLSALYSLSGLIHREHVFAGIQVEDVRFSKLSFSTEGAKPVDPALNLLQVGLAVSYGF